MGIWQWLFGSGTKPESKPVEEPPQQTPPAAPSVPALSPAERAAQIQRKSTSAFIPVTGAAVGGVPAARLDDPLANDGWVDMARAARRSGSIDDARLYYQKAAYGYRNMSPEAVEALKREVAEFTSEDPRFQAAWQLVRGILDANPGMLQSDLGKQTGDNREWFNYVMYYADASGLLVRVKAGRSYRLFLPGQPIPPPPEKPKRIRKPKT